MDNYYNSVELAQYLFNNNTYCTGTLRANRKNNPQEVIKKKIKQRRNDSKVYSKMYLYNEVER